MKAKNTEGRKWKKTLLFDGILVLSLLALALSVFLIFRSQRRDGAHTDVYVDGELVGYYAGSYAEVTVGGELYARYALATDGEFVLNGGTNVLLIEGGRAYMRSATCPDKTCVSRHTKGVYEDGATITCLPNRVRVEIIGGTDG